MRLRNPAGVQTERRIVWDGRDERGAPVPSGVYFFRLGTGENSGAVGVAPVTESRGATVRKLMIVR